MCAGHGTLLGGAGQVVTHREVRDAGISCDRSFVDALFTGDASCIKSDYEDGLKQGKIKE